MSEFKPEKVESDLILTKYVVSVDTAAAKLGKKYSGLINKIALDGLPKIVYVHLNKRSYGNFLYVRLRWQGEEEKPEFQLSIRAFFDGVDTGESEILMAEVVNNQIEFHFFTRK
jgi:hypothetical protein